MTIYHDSDKGLHCFDSSKFPLEDISHDVRLKESLKASKFCGPIEVNDLKSMSLKPPRTLGPTRDH